MNLIKKYCYFLTKPLKSKPLYKKSNLSNAIDYTQKIAVEDKLLDIRMTVIHLFYYNDFKHYCLSNHLNPLDELYNRKIELTDSLKNKNIPMIILLFIGIISSLIMHYMTIRLNHFSTLSTIVSFTLGFIILSYGLLLIYTQFNKFKKNHPKEYILKEYELKTVSKLIEDYLRKI